MTRRERLTSEADEIFEKWMVVKTDWGSYKNTLDPVKFKGLADLYEFADPLMWFKKRVLPNIFGSTDGYIPVRGSIR